MREGWTYKKLEDVVIKIADGSHNPPQGVDFSSYPMLSSKNIFFDYFNYDSPRYLSREAFEEENKRTDISEGDVLLTIVGTIGRTCCVQNPFIPFTLQRSVAVLKPNKECLISRFLMYALHSLSDFWNSEAKGVAQKGVYLKQLATIPIPVPSLSEQQRIVSELDLLSSIIEKKKAQLKEYDKLAQSIFYDMFGDPVTNEKGWEVKKLEDVVSDDCSISYGIVQPGDDVENGVPVVRPIDLVNRIVNCKGLKIVEKRISDSYKRTILKGNELLLCVRGTTGMISFASSELKGCNVTRGITPLSFSERLEKTYVFYLFKTSFIQSFIAEKTRGIALKQINMKDVRELPILIPPLPLQQSFASKIEAIERQKALVQQSIVETQTMFDYTMDKYFG